MRSRQNQNTVNPDHSLDGVIALVFFIVVIALLLYLAFEYVAPYQSRLNGFFFNLTYTLTGSDYFLRFVLNHKAYEDYPLEWVYNESYISVAYLSVFFILLFFLYRLLVVKNVFRIKDNYDLDSFIDKMTKRFACLAPLSIDRVVSDDIETGEWRVAQGVLGFCLANNLIVVDEFSRTFLMNYATAQLAKDCFSEQLGNRFTGVQNMPKHYIYFIYVFLHFLSKDKKIQNKGDELIDNLSLDYTRIAKQNKAQKNKKAKTTKRKVKEKEKEKEKVLHLSSLFEKSEELLEQFLKENRYARDILQELSVTHGYEKTFILGLYSKFRKFDVSLMLVGNVYSSAKYIWLKSYDRELFYLFNGLGRKNFFCEIVGVFDHFITELRYGKQVVPCVAKATMGLVELLNTLNLKEAYELHAQRNIQKSIED